MTVSEWIDAFSAISASDIAGASYFRRVAQIAVDCGISPEKVAGWVATMSADEIKSVLEK